MNALHLLWIVPLSLATGSFLTLVLIGGTKAANSLPQM